MGAGQEADECAAGNGTGHVADEVEVDEVLRAFAECSGGHDATTLDSLLLTLAQRHQCTRDAAMAAVQRAVALRRLRLQGRLARRHG